MFPSSSLPAHRLSKKTGLVHTCKEKVMLRGNCKWSREPEVLGKAGSRGETEETGKTCDSFTLAVELGLDPESVKELWFKVDDSFQKGYVNSSLKVH